VWTEEKEREGEEAGARRPCPLKKTLGYEPVIADVHVCTRTEKSEMCPKVTFLRITQQKQQK